MNCLNFYFKLVFYTFGPSPNEMFFPSFAFNGSIICLVSHDLHKFYIFFCSYLKNLILYQQDETNVKIYCYFIIKLCKT